MKTNTVSLILISLLTDFALLRPAHAVVPPPDGGYPNFTTAEGTNALKNLTTGAGNTGVGWYSLFSDTTASFNTALGVGTLLFNNADENTAIGAAALLFNDASGNTAVGSRALLNNSTGGTLGNIQGLDLGPNVAVGQQALESNTVASANTAVGYQALHSFTAGPVGFEQLGLCTAVGFQALANASGTGSANNAFGYQALTHNTAGAANVAIGHLALSANTIGNSNVATGGLALTGNDTGDGNTAIGFGALDENITGSDNTAIGNNALGSSTGDGNIAVGAQAAINVSTANNVICIGAFGQNINDSCYIGNIFGQTSVSGIQVLVNSDNKLGTATSSKRFKEGIKPMNHISETLFALKPVAFRYKKDIDPTGTSQFGLVAEDVEKVNPDLIVRDKEGKPYSVRYDQVNAMLLNEFLKEHRKVEQQRKDFEAALAQQQKQIEALTAGLEKVSAQLELSKSAPQVAENL